ncbi:MAG: TonB-dependent receptor plug domain-containing protein [Bacteroidales bacterium]|nr:TonB-dependent receptor plug domain-containing protein [Bacteroidales bacterium]
MRSLIPVIFGLLFSSVTLAQTRVIFGELTAYNKYPVANIEVKAQKSKASTRSDSLGNFSLVCQEKDQIKIKAETFKTVSRKVDKNTGDTIRINLVFMDSKKNRDLAIGYGYMEKEDLTFAADHMQQENNEYCNFSNVYELLKGKFPGVAVDGTTGSYRVFIRGAQSINSSSEVLMIVDGSTAASIDGLNPCDIKSIDVIKDGMASMYGSRGSNGVILIETKRGH